MGWHYDIPVEDYLCITGPNGFGKTLILKVICALTEVLWTGSFDPLIKLLKVEREGEFYKYTEWSYIFDTVIVTTDDQRNIEVRAIDPKNGKFEISINGKKSMLPDKMSGEYKPIIPFLDDERYHYYGEVLGDLLCRNNFNYPTKMIDQACRAFLDIGAYPKYFSPLPKRGEYKSDKLWYNALDSWLEPFSHGEKEMMCLSLALLIASDEIKILLIDGFGVGLHLCSQEVLADSIPKFADKAQIIYTTHHPEMMPDRGMESNKEHHVDLWCLSNPKK